MPKKKSRGGPREGSGRKPVEDKAVPLTIYVLDSVVKQLGAQEARMTALKAIYQKAGKQKKK